MKKGKILIAINPYVWGTEDKSRLTVGKEYKVQNIPSSGGVTIWDDEDFLHDFPDWKLYFKKKQNKVKKGYTYYDEYGNLVTVLFIHKKWCLVESDSQEKPYLVKLEFIQEIKDNSESETNQLN
jgi:hypothetical protein